LKFFSFSVAFPGTKPLSESSTDIAPLAIAPSGPAPAASAPFLGSAAPALGSSYTSTVLTDSIVPHSAQVLGWAGLSSPLGEAPSSRRVGAALFDSTPVKAPRPIRTATAPEAAPAATCGLIRVDLA